MVTAMPFYNLSFKVTVPLIRAKCQLKRNHSNNTTEKLSKAMNRKFAD